MTPKGTQLPRRRRTGDGRVRQADGTFKAAPKPAAKPAAKPTKPGDK